MPAPLEKVFVWYGGWSLLWLAVPFLGNSLSGHGEFGLCAHFILAGTGLPLGLLSFHVIPNGTVNAVAVAGLLGTTQWCAVAALNHGWARWQSAKKDFKP